jgi:Mycotoxin biosynthesis protein UstYa
MPGMSYTMVIYPSRNLPIEELKLISDFGISRIPKAQAVRLPNKTYPFAQDEGYYIASLSVFHHLHCLVWHSSKSQTPLTFDRT